MKKNDGLVISQTDRDKIATLLQGAPLNIAELLGDELGRATIVGDDVLPKEVVSMNSQIRFQDVETEKETTVILVYPSEANLDQNKISLFTPVGSALIGLKIGQTIAWPFPGGKTRQLKVISVEK
ncbi:MAG: nucleoside diphosphate kinase regulator [Bdellovibrionaceae bacterium]|nr:nucleoside diphosphate kinase regulator [Pseudobdellovibrionaceae bacterium]